MALINAIEQVKELAQSDLEGDVVAHRKLLEAVHKLQLTAETPFDTTMRQRFQPLQNIAMRIAIECGLLQTLAKKKGEHVTSTELSKETSTDQLLTERLMRMATWMGYAEEVAENTYAANGTTMLVATPGMIGGEKHHTEVIYAIGGKVIPMMREQGFHQFPENGYKDPMEYTFGCDLFEFLSTNDEHKTAFDDYMGARREGTQLQWFDIYPAAERVKAVPVKDPKTDVLLCDVGGGQGHEIVKFKESYPQFPGRLVLQDLARTFKGISLPEGVESMPHDFFQPQPIKGARLYYMRQIMHDWPDSKCRVILGHLVNAMDKDSRLLIDDYVMLPTGAEFRPIHMDICMMMYCKAMERTKTQWEALLDSAGLQIVQIFMPATGFESIIEAKLKP